MVTSPQTNGTSAAEVAILMPPPPPPRPAVEGVGRAWNVGTETEVSSDPPVISDSPSLVDEFEECRNGTTKKAEAPEARPTFPKGPTIMIRPNKTLVPGSAGG